jgi:hypothetical protein
MIQGKDAASFSYLTQDDGGMVEANVDIYWIAIAYNDP